MNVFIYIIIYVCIYYIYMAALIAKHTVLNFKHVCCKPYVCQMVGLAHPLTCSNPCIGLAASVVFSLNYPKR